ncbi:tRNA uridine 5-carboxymethylaminomethyl modification enzyme MnmG, partial [Dissostichus eleginoides]
DVMLKKGLPTEKLYGLGTDGAAVMTASPARAGAPEPELSSSSLPPNPEPTPPDNVTSTPVSHEEKP